MKKPILILLGVCMAFSLAAQVKISGTVIDSERYPLPGANVSVKGQPSLGTSTDIDGKFSIEVPNAQAVLVFSFMGYQTTEKPVGSQTTVNVTMADDMAALDEVVVVGYGTAKKSDVTGALSRVTEKQIKERPVQNAVQALQGKASGVDITVNSRPGEVGEIRIRGNRSINASNDPLYVIDGIPMAAGTISDINPNDIASMEILKDASATAIYGSRGANGVVLISTKKGTKGRVTIDYDGTMTFNRINSMTDYMGSGELLDWQRQEQLNGGTYGGAYGTAPDPARDYNLFMGNEAYMDRILKTAYQYGDNGQVTLRNATPEEIAKGYTAQVPVYDASKLFDQKWADKVTRTGVTQNHQISLSAGSDNARVYLSFAYLDQTSPMVDQDYKRYTANLNGEITPKKWLTVGMSANASYSIQNYGMGRNFENGNAKDSYGQARSLLPYAPAYDEKGNILNTKRVGPSADNVLLNINNSANEFTQYSIMSNMFAEVKFTSWLKYRLNFGAQYRNRRYGSYYGPEFSNPFGSKPEASEANTGYYSNDSYFSWVMENLLYFDKTWGVHTLGVTALQSAQYNHNEGINIRARNLTFPTALWYNQSANADAKPSGYGTNMSETSLMSWMGRINYSLMNKYLITVTGRWDGASVLAEGNKWDFFPSAAVAWKMNEENWLKDVNWINQLKIRAGYGVTGNASVAAYSTTGTIRTAAYVFNKKVTTGYKAELMPNSELGWEKTSQWNVGVDFSFLKDRLSGTIDLYQSNTSDLLMSRSIPAILGYSKIQTNIGKTRNQGVEISLSSVNINNPNFRWTTDVNWSMNKEEILELGNGPVDDKANGWFIGQPITVMRDYEFDRLWQDTPQDKRLMEIYKAVGSIESQPGQSKVVDQQPMILVPEGTEGSKKYTLASGEVINIMDNGFGKISDDDAVILGSNRPDWVGGMTNTFTYKNWEFSFFVYARVGNLYYGEMQTYGRRVENNVWSPENPGGKYYQPTTTPNVGTYNSMQNYTSGTMVSIRNISLSYNFPERWLSKITVRRLQLYAQVLNPFVFGGDLVKVGINPDDTTGWDSKKGAAAGGQSNNTMLIRSYVVGLRIGL